jgi:hypothetical protein
MNKHYQAAIDGLNEIRDMANRGVPTTEAIALAVTQTRAILAVAEEQSKTNTHLETANFIAYAQLCSTMRDGAKFSDARNTAYKAMTGKEWGSAEDGDDF